ncbi:MAG: GNAT family N-acetyltransferase [Acidimicrobiales bacterium]
MIGSSFAVLRWDGQRARTGPWRGDREVAYLVPLPDGPMPTPAFVRHCLSTLAERGFRRVVTGAMSPMEQRAFLAVGFAVAERLHLLEVDLAAGLPPVPAGLGLERAGRRRRDEVLALDRAAFSPFWQFDSKSLSDAVSATPHTRFRVALVPGAGVAGYAICGRSGGRGFVQRLAVDPSCQQRGTGRRLLLDGLHWMSQQGVRRAVVNTQVGNHAALRLYLAAGFREDRHGLSVLSAGLP